MKRQPCSLVVGSCELSPNTTNNGFDIVTVRIPGEGSVVGGAITRTRAWLAIVRSTRIEGRAMELSDLLLAVSLECKMNLGRPIGSGEVECRRTSLLEANVDAGAPTGACPSERRQDRLVEGFGTSDIGNRNADVIHAEQGEVSRGGRVKTRPDASVRTF